MPIGDILVGITLKTLGAGAVRADLESIDLAARRAGVSLAYLQGNLEREQYLRARYAMQMEGLNQRRMRSDAAAARQALQTRAMITGAFAIGGAVAIGAAVDQAAKFQLAMTSVNNTLGATGDQMRTLNSMALHVSGIQAQSATTIAQEMAVAARAGLGQYDRLHSLFPLLARFADVQYFMAQASGQSMSPQDAVGAGVQFAHLFQAYTPEKMGPMLEWITKLQTVSNESLQRALTQGRYFIPMGNVLGLSMEQQFELLASMAQTGFLRGRGGSSLGRTFLGAINAATLTGHAQSKQGGALEDLGLIRGGRNVVVNSDGTLNWDAFTRIMTGDASSMKPSRYIGDLKAGFGVVSSQFMSVFTSKAVQDQLGHIRRQFERLGDDPIGKFFDNIMNNFLPQFQRFVTNFVNLGINIMLPALPGLTAAFKAMADTLGTLGDYLGAHPKAGLAVAITAFIAVGLAAAETAGTLIALRGAILGLNGAAGGNGIKTLLGLLSTGSPLVTALMGLTTLLATSSFMPHSDARRSLISNYGYDYWKYLKGRHPGDLPYSYGPGDMTPAQWEAAHPNSVYGHQIRQFKRDRSSAQGSGPWWDPLWFLGGASPVAMGAQQGRFYTSLIGSLTGGHGGSLSDAVHNSAQRNAQDVSTAIRDLQIAVVGALAAAGVTINVPGQAPIHQKLFGAHGPTPANAGGQGGRHPHAAPRTGGSFKP